MYVSNEQEIAHGDVIEILTIDRLMAPRPLYHISYRALGEWNGIAIESGILADAMNEMRRF